MNENSRLRELLIRHEGRRSKPYRDTVGKLTGGVGRNLDDVGFSDLEIDFMLANDIERVLKECVEAFPWFKSLNLARQDVVASMVFNLGLGGFREFKHTITAIRDGNFGRAAYEMVSSKWAGQVGVRAIELAKIMELGQYL